MYDSRTILRLACLVLLLTSLTSAKLVDFEAKGGKPGDKGLDTCQNNTDLLNTLFKQLKSGDTLYFANTTYWFIGGISATDLNNVTIQIDGTIAYTDEIKKWPKDSGGRVLECMMFERLHKVKFTSAGRGTFDGHGNKWWGAVKYLEIGENRPRLVHIRNATDIIVENLFFKNSPYWNFLAEDIDGLVIRHTDVDARRDGAKDHDLFDLTAFNTDGFDVAGKNVHIHDCNIWNDDDCIAVKQTDGNGYNAKCSENMLFERINASGVGLTIGSIGPSGAHSCVRNITFRDCEMHNTFKGIYVKSRPTSDPSATGEITDVLYQNITIYNPTQWAIWIGPQQASYHDACSLLWPFIPGTKCPVPSQMTWTNITLRDVTIHKPKFSPGVILGNNTNPMTNILFDNVIVTEPSAFPFGDEFYKCDGVKNGTATRGTVPIPPCFNKGM